MSGGEAFPRLTSMARAPRSWTPAALLIGLAVLVLGTVVANRPDRRKALLAPGSSSEPAFVVQVIRPRMGLPLGGLLPPGWVGLDVELGFDGTSAGARVVRAEPGCVELVAEGWEVVLEFDGTGQVGGGTRAEFEMVFEDEPTRVRCRPGQPAVGSIMTLVLASGELAGRFELELARCEDAATGESLDWPPDPLVLYGSFDRLPLDAEPR